MTDIMYKDLVFNTKNFKREPDTIEDKTCKNCLTVKPSRGYLTHKGWCYECTYPPCTVATLIEKLKDLPQDAKVYVCRGPSTSCAEALTEDSIGLSENGTLEL